MKKRFLLFLLVPFLLTGCTKAQPIDHTRKTGEIGDFALVAPENGFSGSEGIVFEWEEATNTDYYQIELATTKSFVTDDEDEVYVRESNLYSNKYALTYSLPTKDVTYYWRVTAINKDHSKKSGVGNFFYKSANDKEIPIEIEDAQDWVLHKQGSYADISIDRSNFFGNGKNSLAIVFDKEHTLNGNPDIPNSKGWIVVTKTEDRELYGTDAFYLNFYYTGHDATVLIRVLDYDGEYWHNQVQISNNSKQTILMRYEDFELRTAGTNIFNRKFDWQHIRYFEIVFERTFGDGVCLISDIKAVRYDNYRDLFVDKLDFSKLSDPKDWTYENYNFDKTISEDGSEITIGYTAKNATTNPDGFSGFGFQNIHLYKFFVTGDAIRMKVKYTGSSSSANFYFRILEEDNDRWQFKIPFSYLVKNEYKELLIPLKAFQRTDIMSGDGTKQFYFIQKLNVGLADNYSSGSISIKDFEVVKLDDVIAPSPRYRTVTADGCIEDFNDYNLYTELYYLWEQSTVNKDEAMKLDNLHKAGGHKNPYCAEFDYKADMEMATYQLYMNPLAAAGKTAFSIWLKDATPNVPTDNPNYSMYNLKDEDVAAEMTIQLTMDTGEWYRYVIDKVAKEWTNYTLAFNDMMVRDADGNITHNGWFLENEASLFDDPNPLSSEHIIHMAFGFKYLFYDKNGEHRATYAIANPVYVDEIYFTDATETSVVEMDTTIKEDPDNPGVTTIETMESCLSDEDVFDYWSYGTDKEYNNMSLSNDVSSQGGEKSLKMHYQGSDSVSYGRVTQFAKSVTAKGICLDIKGDGVAKVYVNLNWRQGATLYKMRFEITVAANKWTHYEIGFSNFTDINGSAKTITANTAREIESISFGIVNSESKESELYASDIYIDNIRFLNDITYSAYTFAAID